MIECATMAEMGLTNAEGEPDETRKRAYFSDLWKWFLADGNAAAGHIAAYLHARDLSKFSASEGQRKTAAHKTLVQTNLVSDYWLTDILEKLEWPTFVRADWLFTKAVAAGEKAGDVMRKLGPTIGRYDYVAYPNPASKEGRWKINGSGRTVYAKSGTPMALDVPESLKVELF